jgi:cobalt-precorrin 5A hydrolase
MGLDQAMIVAGIGCRRGTRAPDIEAALRAALQRAGLAADTLGAIATAAAKQHEPGIAATAEKLGVRLVLVAQAELQATAHRTQTNSDRVRALFGVPSVAEAAALAAAGAAGRLIAPRLAVGSATCALASDDAS